MFSRYELKIKFFYIKFRILGKSYFFIYVFYDLLIINFYNIVIKGWYGYDKGVCRIS